MRRAVAVGLMLLVVAGVLAAPGCGGRPTEPVTTTAPLFDRQMQPKQKGKNKRLKPP